MSIGADSFADFSGAENKINAILPAAPKREGKPDCGDCPSGYYQSVACTSTEDKLRIAEANAVFRDTVFGLNQLPLYAVVRPAIR
jgi:hypothetical protein